MAWQANDKFTYTYDFGDYRQHQVRVEKLLPPTAVPATPVCVSGRRACPPEEVGGPSGYDQRTLDQFSWRYEALDRLLAGEDIREDDVPTWFWTFRPEHFDKAHVNRKLAKLNQLKGNPDFLLSPGGYDYFFADLKPCKLYQENQVGQSDSLLENGRFAPRCAAPECETIGHDHPTAPTRRG